MKLTLLIFCTSLLLGLGCSKRLTVGYTDTSETNVDLPSDAEFKAWGQFSVSRHSKYDERSKSLSVTTNDVVLIKRPSGAIAVVQFTSFSVFTDSGPVTALYRWRYRSSPSQPVRSGTGQVCEDYDRTPSADGKSDRVTPRANHDVTVKAGDIWIDWSSGSETSGYLYYYASQAKIQVLNSDAFDRDL